jgi:hypothetical protein
VFCNGFIVLVGEKESGPAGRRGGLCGIRTSSSACEASFIVLVWGRKFFSRWKNIRLCIVSTIVLIFNTPFQTPHISVVWHVLTLLIGPTLAVRRRSSWPSRRAVGPDRKRSGFDSLIGHEQKP